MRPPGVVVLPQVDRCVAPLTDAADAPLCGAPATCAREVDGLVVKLCAAHARALDAERRRGGDA